MSFNQGKSQVFTIEVTLEDGSQSPPYARRNILVYSGEFGIFRTDNLYGGQVNTKINLPVALYANNPNANLSGINLAAKVHRTSWTKYQDPTLKYPSYKKEEEDLPNLTAVTDSKGNATVSFVPAKIGLYMLTVQGTDARGNLVAKVFYEYITEQGQPAYTDQGGDQLTVSLDKQKYNATDTAVVSVYSTIPNRDVFLSLERGRMDRFQIVHLTGNNGSASVPLISSDVPNMFAKVSSFSDGGMDSNVIDIPVSTNGKRVLVEITPNNSKYGPGDDVTLNISTTDANGNPVSSDVAVWAVDKAIFELSDNTLGDIFNTFWSERYDNTQEAHSLEGIVVYSAESGGCFTQGTKVLMAGGATKNIEDVKVGDYVLTRESPDSAKLVKAKVISLQNAEDDGYLTINDSLKITPDHILWVNGSWAEASVIQKGDKLMDAGGNVISVNTIEWQSAKTKVYNLDIEKYHTFFADGIWVHNQKGESRSTFKDTAYWNPSVQTDSSGKAQVTFKLPDNLTTWAIAAVADTTDTRVGQTTAEIVVSKDIIVRPIFPNILRQGDKTNISALVQNFTDTDHNFNVSLAFDSGNVPTAEFKNVAIKSNSMEELTWEVNPTSLNANAKLTFSAFVADDKYSSDTIVQEIPVVPFEFEEKTGESASGNKTFNVALSPDVNKDKSNITLSLSSTLLGTLPSAMRYLIDYPYGCTEQITSELVPSLVAKSNPTFFADALTGKDINAIINAGISKLINKQNSDGGWTWWFSGASNPFITSYALDNLIYAKSLGYKIDQSALDSAKNYLETPTYYDQTTQTQKDFSTDEWVVKDYGLTILGGSVKAKKIDGNTDGLTPDIQSILVMTNYMNGDENPGTNGLTKLISLANKDGDMAYWNEGSKINFGSKDASTALAIRAIVLAKGDLNIARQGALYLVRNRHYEYWSNTFGTAETIRALTSLSNAQSDLNPNFSYSVNLDGSTLSSGTVNKANQTIKNIVIPVNKIKTSGSNVTVSIDGTGDLYSTLLADEFHTDKNAKAQGNGLTIKREYINEKGTEYTLSPGDTAVVKLTVQGSTTTENYAVITDELPSGMVPINPNFNNEQYGSTTDQSSYFTSTDVVGMDVTQNGVVISLYQLTPGDHVFTYKARVVNAGTFSVPPATVALMYAPEIYGRSDAQNLVIGKTSKTIPTIALQKLANKYLKWVISAVVLTIVIVLSIIILTKKKVFSKKIKNPPPPDVPPSQPIQ
jgi:uncharacterized protein YfaS (alpha-2-macroglobulin family)